MTLLAPTLQAFFTDRLINQKDASPRTIAAYRDAMRLLLSYASQQTGKPPSRLDIEDLDAPMIAAFLDHLQTERGNSPRTRNARLAAIHSLYRYAALRHPEHAHTIARVIEIPTKTHDRRIVSYLEPHEIKALLGAPDRTIWLGRRDHALLLVAIQTGVRVSELAGLRIEHVRLEGGASVKVHGKGRKDRVAALTPGTVTVLRAWLKERQGHSADPVFPTRQGGPLTPKAIAWLLDKHTATAAVRCPSLSGKRITPHVLRHTNAMLLLADNDIATVALWLGHESTKSTEAYLHANNKIKQEAIEKIAPIDTPPGRYKPSDKLLAFLQSL
ncbi:MAG: tyrosine-type recombinase/integrase [Steroidobacteraceae bacterium]